MVSLVVECLDVYMSERFTTSGCQPHFKIVEESGNPLTVCNLLSALQNFKFFFFAKNSTAEVLNTRVTVTNVTL